MKAIIIILLIILILIVLAVLLPIIGGLHRSADGGRSWENLTSGGRISTILIDPKAPKNIFIGLKAAFSADYKGIIIFNYFTKLKVGLSTFSTYNLTIKDYQSFNMQPG